MDSWFCWPAILATLGKLYSQLKKRPGKAKIPASVVVETKHKQKLKIVFVRHRNKRAWLAIVSTKIDLPDEEVVRIYGKRWDIEVFFKMMKHHLNLEKEAQLRDYDGIIGHTTIAMARYVFLVFEQCCHDDEKTIGGLFFACSEEIKDLTLLEAFQRLLSLVLDKVRSSGEFAEGVIVSMMDGISFYE